MRKTDLEFFSWIEYGKGIACYGIINYDGDLVQSGTSKIENKIYLENNKLYEFKGKVYVVDKELFCARGQGYRLKLHEDTVYSLTTGEEVI